MARYVESRLRFNDEDKQREIARKGCESVLDEKRSFAKIMSSPPKRAVRAAKACPMRSAVFPRIISLPPKRAAKAANHRVAISPTIRNGPVKLAGMAGNHARSDKVEGCESHSLPAFR